MKMIDRIRDAQQFLKGRIQVTPLLPSFDLLEESQIYLKAENLQKTGSFKIRGAYYRLSHLTEEEKSRGVIACSAGNHAQGVALAAAELGVHCVICMPESAPISKVQRTESFGATVVLVPGVFDDAFARATELEEEFGYVFIHPFNDLDIIAGQGTIGLEIIDQLPQVDVVLVAVGGGGILAGIGAAIKSVHPRCLVYGVEPIGAASMKTSIESNMVCTLEQVATIADGVAVKSPGAETFSLCQQHVDGFVTVTENQITTAMLKLLEDYKILVEGAGAATVAAAMFGKVDLKGKNVVCVISGGNIDVNLVAKIIDKGLRQTGRVMSFVCKLLDKPGQLTGLAELLGNLGANIQAISHDRSDLALGLEECVVHITVETRGAEHLKELTTAMVEKGYEIRQE